MKPLLKHTEIFRDKSSLPVYHYPHMKQWKIILLLITVAVLLVPVVIFAAPVLWEIIAPPDLGGQTNGYATPTGYQQPTPSPVFLPSRVITVCFDTPPLYPVSLFKLSVNTLANWITAETAIGKGGFIVYGNYVTSQSYNREAFAPILVPAIPNPELPPKPKADYVPKPGDSPYTIADKQKAIDDENKKAQDVWELKQKALYNQLATEQAAVKHRTDAIRLLTPPYDDKAADLWGCLQNAEQNFTAHSQNYLIIASAFVNNTTVNVTSDFTLAHAHVRGIYMACATAPECSEREKTWTDTFLRLGAADIAFYSPARSGILDPQF